MSRVLFQSWRQPLKCAFDRNEEKKTYPCFHLPKTPHCSAAPAALTVSAVIFSFFSSLFFFFCILQCQRNNSSGVPQRRCQTLCPHSLSLLPYFCQVLRTPCECGAVTSESQEILEFEPTALTLHRRSHPRAHGCNSTHVAQPGKMRLLTHPDWIWTALLQCEPSQITWNPIFCKTY